MTQTVSCALERHHAWERQPTLLSLQLNQNAQIINNSTVYHEPTRLPVNHRLSGAMHQFPRSKFWLRKGMRLSRHSTSEAIFPFLPGRLSKQERTNSGNPFSSHLENRLSRLRERWSHVPFGASGTSDEKQDDSPREDQHADALRNRKRCPKRAQFVRANGLQDE